MIMEIVLCANLYWSDIKPVNVNPCRKEFKKIGVNLRIDKKCKYKTSTNVYFNRWESGERVGIASFGTYGWAESYAALYLRYFYGDPWFKKTFINKVMCHEIGHNLGMLHNSRPKSLMYPSTKYVYAFKQRFTARDKKNMRRFLRLSKGWRN